MGGADDGFEYELSLKDSLSGPARTADAALVKLEGDLVKTDAALRGVHGGAHTFASGISYAVRGFDDLARGGRYAANGLLDVGKAFSRLGPYLAGAAIIGGAAAIAKYSFEVSEFKEQTVDAFNVFTGSAEKGSGLFRAVDDLAESVHAPAAEVAGKTKELLELGLTNQAQLTQTVRAIEDLNRVGLEGGARKIEALVERSLAAGHLVLGKGGAGASRALTGTGVSEAELAAQLGVSPKQLEAQLKAGKITVEEGLAAIDRAIIQGKVGALATKRFTLSDAFTDLHNATRKLFQEADDSPINDAMHRLTQSFADGTDGAKQLSEAASLIFKGIGHAIDRVVTFGSTVNTVFDAAWNKIDWLGDKWATLGKSDAEAKQILAQRHTTRAGQIMGGAIADQEAAYAKVQNLAASGASEAEVKATAKRLGIDVSVQQPGKSVRGAREPSAISREIPGTQIGVQDIGPGGERGALHEDQWTSRVPPAMHAAGVDAAKGLLDGVSGPQGFDAHSPSRKMFDIGVDASDGLQAGAEQSGSPGAASNSKSIAVHVDVGGIAMHGSIAHDEFMPLLESQVADVFERVAMELGQ